MEQERGMSRDDEFAAIATGDEAKRRLPDAIARSNALISQYRTRLFLLRRAFDRPARLPVAAVAGPRRGPR